MAFSSSLGCLIIYISMNSCFFLNFIQQVLIPYYHHLVHAQIVTNLASVLLVQKSEQIKMQVTEP